MYCTVVLLNTCILLFFSDLGPQYFLTIFPKVLRLFEKLSKSEEPKIVDAELEDE